MLVDSAVSDKHMGLSFSLQYMPTISISKTSYTKVPPNLKAMSTLRNECFKDNRRLFVVLPIEFLQLDRLTTRLESHFFQAATAFVEHKK